MMRLLLAVCLAAQIGFIADVSSADPVNSAAAPDISNAAKDTGAQVYNVKDYGAKGDGVADDTGSFAETIAAATATHGTVRIPGGRYLATIAVTKGGITIQGDGDDATIIKAPKVTPATRVVVVANSDRTTIRNLTIDGNRTDRSNEKPIDYALLLYESNDCVIENVRVTNAEMIGIGFSASKRTKLFRCNVKGSGWQNVTTLNNKGGGCEGSVISNCRSTNPGYDCIQVTNVGSVTVEDCYVANSPFAGIYVATGARNVVLKNNIITKCYTGIDMSWGTGGGSTTGPDKSEGNEIIGNRVTLCEGGGIGTASNGTLISRNTVLDTGVGAVPSYTLLRQKPSIMSGGRGYRIGDILTFVGGQYVKPAQLRVTGVNAAGEVTAITVYYLGVYTAIPSNVISIKGGAGTGATFSTTWNGRGLHCAGIGVTDAANVTISNNISGNSTGSTAQRYGIALFRLHTQPSHLNISGNTLSGNAVASISPLMRAGGHRETNAIKHRGHLDWP